MASMDMMNHSDASRSGEPHVKYNNFIDPEAPSASGKGPMGKTKRWVEFEADVLLSIFIQIVNLLGVNYVTWKTVNNLAAVKPDLNVVLVQVMTLTCPSLMWIYSTFDNHLYFMQWITY